MSLIGFGFAIVQFFERLQQMTSVSALASESARISGAGSDRQRRFGAHRLALAIPVDSPLHVGRAVYSDRRSETGAAKEQMQTPVVYCNPSHVHRLVCILRRATRQV